MDKSEAIKHLKQAKRKMPQLKKLHHDDQIFVLWRDKVRNIIKTALDSDDYSTFSSQGPWKMRGIFQDSDYQQEYLEKLKGYETALKSIIQKYKMLGIETKPTATAEQPKAPEDFEEKKPPIGFRLPHKE